MKQVEMIQLKMEELILTEMASSAPCNVLTCEGISNHELSLVYKKVHRTIINSLISVYIRNRCVGYDEEGFDLFIEDFEGCDFYDFSDFISIDEIPIVCEELHIDYLNSEVTLYGNSLKKKKSKKNFLEIGAVYTPDEIAYSITFRTLKNLGAKSSDEINILDFAAGTGRFYRQVVKCCKEIWGLDEDYSITKNIYAIDVDPIAVNICRVNALALLNEKSAANMSKISEHIICGNALVRDNMFSLSKNDSKKPPVPEFDAIVSNPPYLVLKPNRNKMDEETVNNIMNAANYYRTSGDYSYSIEGMLNLYQISLEAMVRMLKDGGELGIICPSTLFADVSATKLRKYFLARHCVSRIRFFSEDDQLFNNVNQATCIFHLKKNDVTSQITIERGDKCYNIHINDVKAMMPVNWEIPCIDVIEWDILKKMREIPKLQQHTNIRNKRGELDLSMYKGFITKDETPYRLVRGNMLSYEGIKDINHEYVIPSFLKNKSDDFIKNDFGNKRLVCQQISNQSQRIRLHFVLCERNDILGNSCNYISVAPEYINPLMMLLNSALLNWRFKVTSTNNHINNYELDELPILDLSAIDESVMQLDGVQKDERICQLYGLNAKETNFILSDFYETI